MIAVGRATSCSATPRRQWLDPRRIHTRGAHFRGGLGFAANMALNMAGADLSPQPSKQAGASRVARFNLPPLHRQRAAGQRLHQVACRNCGIEPAQAVLGAEHDDLPVVEGRHVRARRRGQ